MTIHLPHEVESSIEAAVLSGRFESVDDAMTEAARLLLRAIDQEKSLPRGTPSTGPPDPLLGVWSDSADEMDEIVADAMRHRRQEPWRTVAGE